MEEIGRDVPLQRIQYYDYNWSLFYATILSFDNISKVNNFSLFYDTILSFDNISKLHATILLNNVAFVILT